MIVVVDYGLGNLLSIANMHKKLGVEVTISNDPAVVAGASKLILPGVGHFRAGMQNLQASGLSKVLDDQVLVQKKPILGICLGAQLMTRHSEEGDTDGLGWVDADTVKFSGEAFAQLKIPHMGWRAITLAGNNRILENLPDDPRFYFVHSYHFRFTDEQQNSANAEYGYVFSCAFNKDNIYGTQFHPEKSHKFGMKVLQNFASL